MNVIKKIIKNNPELLKNKKGVPYPGNKLYDLKYSNNVQAIIDGYSLYTEKLFDLELSKDAITDCTLDSGDPAKYKIFKPILLELNKIDKDYGYYRYTRASGELECRKRVIDYMNLNEFYNLKKPLDESNVIFTISTTHALNLILKIIGHKNDVIIVPSLNYGLFTIICERLGMNVIYIDLDPNDNYLINPKKLNDLIVKTNNELKEKYKDERHIPKVIAFLNENPNNPTGKVMGKKNEKILKGIATTCKKNDVFVIDDLVYKDTTYDYDNIAMPVGNYNNSFDNTITLYGLSKSFGAAGFRSGIIIANNYIIKGIKNIIFQEMDSVPKYLSYSCSGAYNNDEYRNKYYKEYFGKLIGIYKERYRLLEALINGTTDSKLLRKINKYHTSKKWNGIKGIKLIDNLKPESGFFAIVDFTGLIDILRLKKPIKEEDFYKYLYVNVGIKYIMGKSFGWNNPNQYVGRINFGESEEIIIKTFLTLNKFIEKNML